MPIERKKYPKLGIDPVKDILAEMEISQKAAMLSGYQKPEFDSSDENGEQTSSPPKLKDVAASTQGISKFGIPSVQTVDGPSGLRFKPFECSGTMRYATAFPTPLAMASTWNEDLISEVGSAIASEALEFGIDFVLAPALNIIRDPLGGRNFEYYSEDPLLSGKFASAMVKGIQSVGVGATLKHFALNNQETDRRTLDVIVEERPFREIYLRGFEIAVKEAKPWAIMTAYNKINGEYSSEKSDLLTEILRDEWGFDGVVITDWMQMGRFACAVKAQNDIVMPHGDIWDAIRWHEVGLLSSEEIDRCIVNILNFVLKTNNFKYYKSNAYTFKKRELNCDPDMEGNKALAEKAGSEGMVILKNENNALPLGSSTKRQIAVYGVNTDFPLKGGAGSGLVHSSHTVSLRKGLEDAGLQISTKTNNKYNSAAQEKEHGKTDYTRPEIISEMPEEELITYLQAKEHANDQEISAALISIGRVSGETNDRLAIKGDYYLSDTEMDLISNVSRAYRETGKTTIVILNIGGVIDIEKWHHMTDAILLAWQPGQECGRSIANILTGKTDPCGRLPVTFAKSYDDYPSSNNFPGDGLKVKYEEGLYVGYRYFTSKNKDVTYPFGFGLSYTRFTYSDLLIDTQESSNEVRVSVNVVNTGNRAGREVVQLYVRSPADRLEKVTLELKAFKKTGKLSPGEGIRVEMLLTPENMKCYDDRLREWIVEKGRYEVLIGASCIDIRETGSFTIEKEIVLSEIYYHSASVNTTGAKDIIEQ